MKKFRNILAMLMVFVMLVAVMPMNVFAEGKADPAPAEPTTFTVTVNQSENGSVTANPASAAKDAEVTLTVTPAEGYELDKLTVAGKTATNVTVTENKFTMPDEDVTVTATFKKKAEPKPVEHKITIAETTNGTVTANPTNAAKDAEVTLTVTPAEGYELDKLTVAGTTATNITVTENKFTMPDEDVTVTATFKKKTEEKPDTKPGYYNVSVYSYAHGTAKVNTSLAKAGETITVTATPNYGYAVKRVYYKTADGTTVNLRNNSYNDYYYYGYNGRYYDGYYGDYYRYYSDYEKYYYTDYSSYDAYLKDRHYSFWNNGYRYWDDYDYKYYNRYYDKYYDDYYRYYDDYVDNYYSRYSSYEDYLYAKHYNHYYDYRYYDKYDYRYYNYTTTDTFEMPASNVTVYVEFTDWLYYGYYYDDYYYYRYYRDKKDKVKDKKAEEKEEEKVVEKTPQVYEASATINVGSNVFTKVNKNVTTTHQMDVAAYVKNGRVMLPLRYVAEALGLQVSWVPETKTVIIWDLTQRVEIPIKSNKIIVNGVTYTSDVKPEIKNSRTMLPIANVARALGLIDGSDIIWDPVMKQVKLTRRVISK